MIYNELTQRESLQTLFDNSFNDGDREQLRKHYRDLRSLEFQCEMKNTGIFIDISNLTQNLTVACDIVTADNGKNFVYCGNDVSPVACNPRLISKALLSLMSNAYIYSSERLTVTKTIECKNFIKIEVKSGGQFQFGRYENRNGLRFVNKVCLAHGGRLIIESEKYSSSAIMMIDKSADYSKHGNSFPDKTLQSTPDFYELLKDRLSPVYTEFFGI